MLIRASSGSGGGGTKEVQYITKSFVANTFVDIGVKSSDASIISLEVSSLYSTFIKDSGGNWSVEFSPYFAIQVNGSGNIEIRSTYGGNAKIYYV